MLAALALALPASVGLALGQPGDRDDLTRVRSFFREVDAAIVARDRAAFHDRWNLDGRQRADQFLAAYADLDVRGHDSRVVAHERIGDTWCVHVHTTVLTRSASGSDPRSAFDRELGEQYLFLLQVDGQTFRILKAEPIRGNVRFESREGWIACPACNFRVQPERGWFHVHHHGASVRSAESIQLHHVSGKITLELQVVERLEEIDLREEIEWDNRNSLVGLAQRSLRVIRDGPLEEPSRELRAYERDVAVQDLAGHELRIWRIYRARENVLYAMTAFGQAETFDLVLTELERMFHSFEILDPRVSPHEQASRMMERHRPLLAVLDGDYSNERNNCFMRGPKGWRVKGNSAGARWARLADGEREIAAIELSTSPPSRSGWSDPDRIQRSFKAWESVFQKAKGVRRGSLRLLHPIRCREHNDDPDDLLSTLCYKADYGYETEEGAPRRVRIYLVPVGKLLHRISCDTDEHRFAELEEAFDQAVRTLRVPSAEDRERHRRGR